MAGRRWSIAWLTLVTAVTLASDLQAQQPIRATGEVEIGDPKGDMRPISSSRGGAEPLDITKLTIRSDGQRLTFAATLNDPPGPYANTVVEVYIDADDDDDTGVEPFDGKPGGFDFVAALRLCLDYGDAVVACLGSLGDDVKSHFGAMELHRLEGDHPAGPKTPILRALEVPGQRTAERVPLAGTVVTGQVPYADLGVASGDTIRLLAFETGGTPVDLDGAFPLVVLKLN